MKYSQWLDAWLRLYVAPTVKLRTYEKYSQIVRTRITPTLGNYELDDLTTDLLQNFVVQSSAKYSANTVNGTITVLQKSIKMAYLLKHTSTCQVDLICRPKVEEKGVDCFSIEEQRKIEQYIVQYGKTKLYGILLCLYTGLRIGELLALEWKDVGFQDGLLSVNKSCHYGKNKNGVYGRIIDTPKTPNSKRVIPIPKTILPLLKQLKKESNCQYVVSSKGKPIATRNYQSTFEGMLKRLNIPHKGFHSLRHTFATRAIECGMDVKTLSEILGHKNPTITLNRYVHSLLDHKKSMMNKLAKYCNLTAFAE